MTFTVLLPLLTCSCLVVASQFDRNNNGFELPRVNRSQFYSLGRIKQHVGHINDSDGLKTALEACAYSNGTGPPEVILIASNDHFIDGAAQTVGMLWWVTGSR
jgi:hypothetical protein